MSARDDFGSDAGRGSSYKGGAGGLGNGGVGGGRGGGAGGGGAGRNGGIGSQTGLTTGNKMYGTSAYGRPGGRAQNPGAWGVRPGPNIQQGPLNRPTYPGPISYVNPPVSPQPQPGLSFTYDTLLPPGAYPGNYWAGGAMWNNVNRPPNYSGPLGPTPVPANGPVYSNTNPYGINNPGGKGDFQGNNFNGYKGYY